jgi:predicted DNA-binding transcriptional regulator AlpA
MGAAEIAELLGISRQRTQQIVNKAGFPTPVAELAMGKIWDATAVREWAKKDGRLPND